MSILNLENDAINIAMIEGLKNQLRSELKEELMKPVQEAIAQAEQKIDGIINIICERIDIQGTSFKGTSFDSRLKNRIFCLEWIINHNK